MSGYLLDSTNLLYATYQAWSATLVIEFRTGRVYEFYGVPASLFRGLLSAGSHGRYFHQHIRDRHAYRRVA